MPLRFASIFRTVNSMSILPWMFSSAALYPKSRAPCTCPSRNLRRFTEGKGPDWSDPIQKGKLCWGEVGEQRMRRNIASQSSVFTCSMNLKFFLSGPTNPLHGMPIQRTKKCHTNGQIWAAQRQFQRSRECCPICFTELCCGRSWCGRRATTGPTRRLHFGPSLLHTAQHGVRANPNEPRLSLWMPSRIPADWRQ